MMDEIFQRISNLEKEKIDLLNKIKDLDEKIEEENTIPIEEIFKAADIPKVNEREKEKENKIIQNLSNKLNAEFSSSSIKYKFTYLPMDPSYKSVFISGNFNNWSMTEMTKCGKEYIYEAYLKKGYEYIYCYYADGEKLIDFSQCSISVPQKDNGEYNIITIPEDNDTIIKYEDIKDNIEWSKDEIMSFTGKNEDLFIKDLLQYNEILNSKKQKINEQKKFITDKFEKSYNNKINNFHAQYEKLIKKFKDLFLGRILFYKNKNLLIKDINFNDQILNCLILYDSNGIKVNTKSHEKKKLFTDVSIDTFFNTSIILSKEESESILEDYKKDNTHFLKIFYQILTHSRVDKEILPYKVQPETVDIAQYDFVIDSGHIIEVRDKQTGCYVFFDPVLIGDTSNESGLVASSSIKVYTTLYNKDILNILHIHLNDTSQEITVDSEFLEKDENINKHKVFLKDAMGKRLNYKFLFKDYKLIKIFYAMSDDYIDEPLFEEFKFNQNSYYKIDKGDYKNFYCKITGFPLGMLARKDKEDNELQKMKSFGYQKEGYCGDRHLEELPGFVSVDIMFDPETILLEENIHFSIPICHLKILSQKEDIELQKKVIMNNEMKDNQILDEFNKIYNLFKDYEKYISTPDLLDKFNLEQLKEILSHCEKQYDWKDLNSDEEDLIIKQKINFINESKTKLANILYTKIRFAVFNKK